MRATPPETSTAMLVWAGAPGALVGSMPATLGTGMTRCQDSTRSVTISGVSDEAERKPRPYRGVGAEERRADRLARLLDAGVCVVAAKGWHATTVRDVCAASKLTERYFYEA